MSAYTQQGRAGRQGKERLPKESRNPERDFWAAAEYASDCHIGGELSMTTETEQSLKPWILFLTAAMAFTIYDSIH